MGTTGAGQDTAYTSAERLDAAAFEACREAFDDCVEAEPDIDRFCSRSEWILPYHRAFVPDRDLYLYRGGSDSFVALASRTDRSVGPYLESVENMWCFACPLLGPDAIELLEHAIADCGRANGAPPVPLLLSGLADLRDRHSLLGRLVVSLQDRYDVHAVDETRRYAASLEGGFDGWLARRKRSFRKSLRAAVRRAEPEGLVFEHIEVADEDAARALYPRILAIEGQTWKAADGNGADTGAMRDFYADMLPRLAARAALRVLVVQRDGEDLGYLHGGLVGNRFRGLQVSYRQDCDDLSLGNLLQREMLIRLCDEGCASYDLGTRSEYKSRWAEDGLRTVTVMARPR